MCTAAAYRTDSLYFGRTLDYESSYGEDIVVMPRNFKLEFRSMPAINEHYAVIGTAHVMNGYPLFYDAANIYPRHLLSPSFPASATLSLKMRLLRISVTVTQISSYVKLSPTRGIRSNCS